MRKRLFCTLALLCGAEVAHAQQYPIYPNYAGYQQATAAASSEPYPIYRNPGLPGPGGGGVPPNAPQLMVAPNIPGPYAGNPGYGGFNSPQPGYSAPGYYPQGYPQPQMYPQGYPQPQSYPQGYPQAQMYPQGYPQPQMYPQPMANMPAMPSMPTMGMPPAGVNGGATANMPTSVPAADSAGDYLAAPATPLPYPADDRPADNGPFKFFGCDSYGRNCKEHVWASMDYTMSWMRTERAPGALATNGFIGDDHPGALGQPGTTVVFGDHDVDFGMFSGVRFEVGFFLDQDSLFSLEAIGQYIFPNHEGFTQASDNTGNPLIARPITNAITGTPGAVQDSLPGVIAGGITIDMRSEFISAEINARCHVRDDDNWHWDSLFGFRFVRLQESLAIQDQLTPLADGVLTFNGMPVNMPNTLGDIDRFRTSNNFYGLQLGTQLRYENELFFAGAYAKIALGATDEAVDISGSTTLFSAAGNQVATGGVLALPSNIGNHNRTVLGYVPEGGFTAGVNLCRHVQLTAGYSFLFWNQVARPSGQVDMTVNPNAIPSSQSFGAGPGPARPTFSFNDESFWVHTITVGFVVHF